MCPAWICAVPSANRRLTLNLLCCAALCRSNGHLLAGPLCVWRPVGDSRGKGSSRGAAVAANRWHVDKLEKPAKGGVESLTSQHGVEQTNIAVRSSTSNHSLRQDGVFMTWTSYSSPAAAGMPANLCINPTATHWGGTAVTPTSQQNVLVAAARQFAMDVTRPVLQASAQVRHTCRDEDGPPRRLQDCCRSRIACPTAP